MKEWVLPLVLGLISGGGLAVAIIGLFKDKLDFTRKRKAEIEDRGYAEILKKQEQIIEWQKKADEQFKVHGEGMKFLLYNMIKNEGQAYIAANQITFEDRKTLHAAHNVYHNGLSGNGDLDDIMRDVDEIPLKV